ncbi:MAG: hypothetical protein GWN14_15170, partial [candidate division Zixibacteria bacterium]|nr:hypothetical protein [Gammaproteobacteria bacterium]NIX57223.1 hypothetical protein [candidate division Zixibacteria bacterium]
MADDNDDIQTEFDAICGIMEEVDGYSVEEVHGLVERIETLEAKVKTSEHPRKKVLLFRLKKCREFCQFILE